MAEQGTEVREEWRISFSWHDGTEGHSDIFCSEEIARARAVFFFDRPEVFQNPLIEKRTLTPWSPVL
jgi:hypothetical protein